MRYELIALDKLTKFYMSSAVEQSLAEEAFAQWKQQVYIETERIKSVWRTVASEDHPKLVTERFLRCREDGLLSLINCTQLMPTAFQNVLYRHLEELLIVFVNIFPVWHSGEDRRISIRSLPNLRRECGSLYRRAHESLRSQRIPPMLIDTALRPIKDVACLDGTVSEIAFSRLLFVLRIESVIKKQLEFPYGHPDYLFSFIRLLCYINFNGEEISHRIMECIKKRLDKIDDVYDEKKLLDSLCADLSDMNILSGSYEAESRSLRVVLMDRLAVLSEARAEVINMVGREDFSPEKEDSEASVLKLAMTIEELGLFYRLKAEANGIRLRKQSLRATFYLMSRFMRTVNKGVFTPFSAHSLAQKFYIISDSAIRSTRDLLKRMMHSLEEIERHKKSGLPMPKVKYY